MHNLEQFPKNSQHPYYIHRTRCRFLQYLVTLGVSKVTVS